MRFVPDAPMMPRVWQVCFVGRERRSWWDWLLSPGYRHCFMLGYVPAIGHWLLYDVLFWRTTIAVVTPSYAGRLLTVAASEGGVMAWPAPGVGKPTAWLRWGFWCVPAIKHVLGLRCVALTPEALHDFLVRNGAKPLLAEETHEPVRII